MDLGDYLLGWILSSQRAESGGSLSQAPRTAGSQPSTLDTPFCLLLITVPFHLLISYSVCCHLVPIFCWVSAGSLLSSTSPTNILDIRIDSSPISLFNCKFCSWHLVLVINVSFWLFTVSPLSFGVFEVLRCLSNSWLTKIFSYFFFMWALYCLCCVLQTGRYSTKGFADASL